MPDTRGILARMLRGCRACRATFPFLARDVIYTSRAYSLPDWSAGGLLRCIVLSVCLCVVSFSKFHVPDTHDLLRTSRSYPPRPIRPTRHARYPRDIGREDATRMLRGNCFRGVSALPRPRALDSTAAPNPHPHLHSNPNRDLNP